MRARFERRLFIRWKIPPLAPNLAGEKLPIHGSAFNVPWLVRRESDDEIVLTLTGVLSAPGTPMDGVEFVAEDWLDLVGSKPPKQSAGNPTSTQLPLEELVPVDCGAGMSVAMPLTMLGLTLMRRRSY